MTLYRRSLGLLALVSAVQLTFAALVPLDPDETYYWDWSRHLATGYFDHPPMVALFIKLGVTLFGVTSFGVRAFSIVAATVATLFVINIARNHGGDRAAWTAARIACALPVLTAWLLLATPDPVCYLFSMATLFAVDRALSHPERSRESLVAWSGAGVTLGLAFASKYMAVLIPLAILVACVIHPRLRRRFAEPGPYIACAIAAVVFMPVVIWNANHDWASFRFQLGHGLAASGGGALARVAGYVAGQAAFVSPLLFLMMVPATLRGLRRNTEPRQFLLAVVATVVFAWFLVSAVRQPVEANWPMLAYPAAAIVLALVPASPRLNRWTNAGIGVGAVLTLLIGVQMLVRVIPFPPDNDPVRRGHGWPLAARAVDAAVAASDSGKRHTWVAANRYQDASELAFQMAGHPAVFSFNLESRPNQYDFWPGLWARAQPCDNLVALLDDATDQSVANTIATHFQESRMGPLIAREGALPLFHLKRIWSFMCWDGSRLPRPERLRRIPQR